MKRKDLIRHLVKNGCALEREGKKHTLFFNPKIGKNATIPRHTEINTFTARGICKDLGVEVVKGK